MTRELQDAMARRLYELAAEREMIVFWHCGPAGIEPRLGQYLNQVKHYEAPIREQPRTTFVLGHAGARQFEEALALQRRHPNVWLETSSQSLSTVRRMILEGDPTRIVHGSDWPFYHPAISVAKVLIATHDLGQARGHVVEVAGVDRDIWPAAVQLDADAVELGLEDVITRARDGS